MRCPKLFVLLGGAVIFISGFIIIPVNVSLKRTLILCGDTIYWTKDRSILQRDFKSLPIKRDDGNSIRVAESFIGFTYKLKFLRNSPHIESFAYFIKSKSWMIDSSSQTIVHELGHFDIEEIYAKQFEEIVNKKTNMRLDSFVVELKKIYYDYNEKANEAQKEYDRYSSNSLGQEQKLEWIEEQLKLLNLR